MLVFVVVGTMAIVVVAVAAMSFSTQTEKHAEELLHCPRLVVEGTSVRTLSQRDAAMVRVEVQCRVRNP